MKVNHIIYCAPTVIICTDDEKILMYEHVNKRQSQKTYVDITGCHMDMMLQGHGTEWQQVVNVNEDLGKSEKLNEIFHYCYVEYRVHMCMQVLSWAGDDFKGGEWKSNSAKHADFRKLIKSLIKQCPEIVPKLRDAFVKISSLTSEEHQILALESRKSGLNPLGVYAYESFEEFSERRAKEISDIRRVFGNIPEIKSIMDEVEEKTSVFAEVEV